MYKVVNKFKELNHDGHIYEVGDTYPAEGKKFVKTRAEFLTTVHPKLNMAFLEEIEEKKPTVKNVPTKETVEKSDE